MRYGKKYPAFVRAVATRHIRYNKTLRYIWKEVERGRALVIQPPAPLGISSIEHEPGELQRVYDIGRRTGEEMVGRVQAFLAGD